MLGVLSPFLWYDFPTADFVHELAKTDLMIVHGEADTIIGPQHSAYVLASYRGTGLHERIVVAKVGHNELIWSGRAALDEALERIARSTTSAAVPVTPRASAPTSQTSGSQTSSAAHPA